LNNYRYFQYTGYQLYQFLRKRLSGYGASEASRQNHAQHVLSVAKAALEQERSPAAMSDQRNSIIIHLW